MECPSAAVHLIPSLGVVSSSSSEGGIHCSRVLLVVHNFIECCVLSISVCFSVTLFIL